MIKKLCMALVAFALGTASAMATVDVDSVYVENATIAAGKTGTLTVKIMNKSNVQSVGMYITLPDGITADASAVALNDLLAPATNDTIAANNIDGACRVAILGKAGLPFQDYEGTLFTIPVTVASTVANGTYDVVVSNAELSTTSNAVINLASTTATITVGGAKGDVNGDGSVTVADVSAIITMICGGQPVKQDGSLITKDDADVNGDGDVTVADVSLVISIICGTEE